MAFTFILTVKRIENYADIREELSRADLFGFLRFFKFLAESV